MYFAISNGNEIRPGVYSVDLITADVHATVCANVVAEFSDLPYYTHVLVIENGVCRMKTEAELQDEIYSEVYRLVGDYYRLKESSLSVYVEFASGSFHVKCDAASITYLTAGEAWLTEGHTEMKVKDVDNRLHVVTPSEFAELVRQAKLCLAYHIYEKMGKQESLRSMSYEELQLVKDEYLAR
jgi:hypothetical protein